MRFESPKNIPLYQRRLIRMKENREKREERKEKKKKEKRKLIHLNILHLNTHTQGNTCILERKREREERKKIEKNLKGEEG